MNEHNTMFRKYFNTRTTWTNEHISPLNMTTLYILSQIAGIPVESGYNDWIMHTNLTRRTTSLV